MDHRGRPGTGVQDEKRTLHVGSFHPCSKTLLRARSLLSLAPPRTLMLTEEPGEADVILYLEDGYLGLSDLPEIARRVRRHPAALHSVFSENDWPYPVLPGAYPSLARGCGWADGWSYLLDPSLDAGAPSTGETARYLFSFLGRVSTHPIREDILRLDAPDRPCLDLASAPERLPGFDFARSYTDLIDRSRFVLCPRGFGASSIRIYEAMGRGRVPVVVGDAWRPPPGPAWDDFAVRIPECRVAAIPDILYAMRHRAAAMGARAAQEFREHYAPEVFFDRLVDFLWRKYRIRSAPLPPLAIRAFAALGWREVRTVAHRLRHRA